jgi:hypothetical protein
MSDKSHRLDSFSNNGFKSVEMNAYSKTECHRHDPYLPLSIQMGRTYVSHDYFMLVFNGLKSVVTILAEAMPLSPYAFECKFNFISFL